MCDPEQRNLTMEEFLVTYNTLFWVRSYYSLLSGTLLSGIFCTPVTHLRSTSTRESTILTYWIGVNVVYLVLTGWLGTVDCLSTVYYSITPKFGGICCSLWLCQEVLGRIPYALKIIVKNRSRKENFKSSLLCIKMSNPFKNSVTYLLRKTLPRSI